MMKNLMALSLMVAAAFFASNLYADDPVIGPGKQVKLDYTLFVNNEQVETSVGKEPLMYVVGDNTIIPGLESQLNGLRIGEEKAITVPAKEAYGEADPKALKEFPKSSLPKNVELKVGMVLQATAPDGENFPAVISQIKEDKVVLDFNHPLAGKELKFNVKIISITNAAPKTATPKDKSHSLEAPMPVAKPAALNSDEKK
jgi:FKBP-type peptidyl-prolyl cis-trans isomerase SlyD